MSVDTTRFASADRYAGTLRQFTARQSQLSGLQEQLSAAKRVLRPSDDPAAVAQAERANTRLWRLATDQRALEVQRNAVGTAESALGHAGSAMQDFRTLVIQAGNAALSTGDRAGIAQQLTSLRAQLLELANSEDSNGLPLFAGLGSSARPFADVGGGVAFDGLAGQTATSTQSVPAALDGHATWMDVPSGNGVFSIAQAPAASTVYSDAGRVLDPSALTGHDYRVQFASTGGVMRYDVIDTSNGGTLVQAGQSYQAGQPIVFEGISLTANGSPTDGDALIVAPSQRIGLFGVLDQAIAAVRDAPGGAALAHGIAQALVQVDAGMNRLLAARGMAGELLNRIDNIADRQGARGVQLQTDRSRAEDLDLVQAISELQNTQTAYSAALGSYAQIQKLSLFNYIN